MGNSRLTSLEQDVVMGTFTHRTTYLPKLLDSVKRFLPGTPFIIQIADLPIAYNFEALRQKFAITNKRYWLFLDDDIQFLDSEIIHKAVTELIANKWALIGAYSTFDPAYELGSDVLECKEVSWMPGYFQLIDSKKIGHIQPDFDLPDPNTAIDTSYSVTIRSQGYKVGICSGIVYHTYKKYAWANQRMVTITNEYLWKKWGQFYFDACQGFFNIKGAVPSDDLSIKEQTISCDLAELRQNRARLVKWQQERYSLVESDKVKLHLGCGSVKYPGYINSDIQGDVDALIDLQVLPFGNNSIDEISSHHSLEHIPYRRVEATLREWHRVLRIGGHLDLGMPDIELVCKYFITAPETQRWDWYIHTLYGQQGTTTKLPKMLTEDDPLDFGQFHQGGLTRRRLRFLLEKIGFEILESFNYDGNDTPSVWVFAQKVRD